MKAKLIEHVLSLLFVSAVLLGLLFWARTQRPADLPAAVELNGVRIPDLSFTNLNDAFEQALLQDVAGIYYPGRFDQVRAAVDAAVRRHEASLRSGMERAGVVQRLTWGRGGELGVMYLKFVVVYVVVMLLTYYGVQTLAVWRFCRRRRAAAEGRRVTVVGALGAALRGVASFVLFCPAYVIAYSMRTELNTETVLFMTVLCVISNGLLILYTNKFYAFLMAESRKGYVDTAEVKNLRHGWGGGAEGISLGSMLRPVKRFGGHVLEHIFRNAHFQYLSTVKEQASFLITGMIITEMALNIHGYLNYEMLRQLLYRNWDVVIAIVMGIFYTVKATEVFTDWMVHRAAMSYENRS